MFHFLNLCIILIFSILTVTEGQFLDPLNNQQNQIQNNLNNDSQNNVQGYLQNDSKNNNHKEENLEESAKIMINKIEKLVVEYQKLKQNQEDLQKKFTKLEKIVASLNESKAKDNISNVQQKSYENEATKQNKVFKANSNKSTQNNESNLQKNDNFSLDLFNWNESNNLLSNDANLKEKHDYINQFQKSNGISQNYRRSNFPVNPIINNSPNLMTRQAINPNPLNDIFNHQNFAQTQNFIGKGLQQLPYYGRRLYETQIQNPVQYQTYVYSK